MKDQSIKCQFICWFDSIFFIHITFRNNKYTDTITLPFDIIKWCKFDLYNYRKKKYIALSIHLQFNKKKWNNHTAKLSQRGTLVVSVLFRYIKGNVDVKLFSWTLCQMKPKCNCFSWECKLRIQQKNMRYSNVLVRIKRPWQSLFGDSI